MAVLGLVVPEDCVVTDRTAAWLWGAPRVLAPGDHLATPAVSVFSPPGHRLRNGLVASGERRLVKTDVSEVDGLRVTAPLRTACDLGRLLHRDQALAGMDALASLGVFRVEELVVGTARFAGFRGVIQLRVLAALVDPWRARPARASCAPVVRRRPAPAAVPGARGDPMGFELLDRHGSRHAVWLLEYDGEAFHGT